MTSRVYPQTFGDAGGVIIDSIWLGTSLDGSVSDRAWLKSRFLSRFLSGPPSNAKYERASDFFMES